MKSEVEIELGKFFAWARARAYEEFEKRIEADATLDPNWAFSDIMQELLDEYRQIHQAPNDAPRTVGRQPSEGQSEGQSETSSA